MKAKLNPRFLCQILAISLFCTSQHTIQTTNANEETSSCSNKTNDSTDTCTADLTTNNEVPSHKFHGCRLFLARSTLNNSTSTRLGLFTGKVLKRGQPIASPDIIIQLIDYLPSLSDFVSKYSYEPGQFGAQFEGKCVASILPGVASIAQFTSVQQSNAVPIGRDVDEANVPRTKYPGAGALTHYHNLTFHARKDLEAGSEIFIGLEEKEEWYQHRWQMIHAREKELAAEVGSNEEGLTGRTVDWLMDNGVCLANLMPEMSTIKGAGRGAFATRFIPKGAIVSASPLVPIDRSAAMTKRIKLSGKVRASKPQLLVNYCMGRDNSTVIFYPTAPVVNLINHGQDKANVRLQWSSLTARDVPNMSSLSLEEISLLNFTNIVMDYVAIKDIHPNDEVVLDYGQQWKDAWQQHVTQWSPPNNANTYSPSYVMDEVAALIRTEKEQLNHPYSSSVMTACFYRYSTHERNEGIARSKPELSEETTVVKWKADRRAFNYRNLRPCSIMQRFEVDGQITYTAMMKNWNGMRKEELIPKGEMHVVNTIPRNAIKFVDKLYSTDMHLSNGFRHEIQIPENM